MSNVARSIVLVVGLDSKVSSRVNDDVKVVDVEAIVIM